MCLCVKKCFFINNVKLHMHTFLLKVASDNSGKVHKTLISGDCGRKEFLVVKSTVRSNFMVKFGNRSGCGCRAFYVLTSSWGTSISKRFLSKTSIRKCSNIFTE